MGANCVVLGKELAVACCPLPKGVCVWKHRSTGICRHDPKISDTTVVFLANRVGLAIPTEDQLLTTKERLLQSIRSALKE